MKQECYEIRKLNLVLLHMFYGVFVFVVNGMKIFTEIGSIGNADRCTSESQESSFFLS